MLLLSAYNGSWYIQRLKYCCVLQYWKWVDPCQVLQVPALVGVGTSSGKALGTTWR